MKEVSGFSKCSKNEKIAWLTTHYFSDAQQAEEILKSYWNDDTELQQLHDEFSENTITNYYLPFGIAPNFKINGTIYAIPMVTEESSVVAAACKAAKFWMKNGGFKAEVLGTTKSGQIHFLYDGTPDKLNDFFTRIQSDLLSSTRHLTTNMRKRNGGITALRLVDKTRELANYYQIDVDFETADAMGANFINSCLEHLAKTFETLIDQDDEFDEEVEIIMSILSNYVPHCRVRAEVSCSIYDFFTDPEESQLFAHKFEQAVRIAQVAPERAVTHNKGVMNGIDAVILATGNDFRAVEACAQAYAARSGKYSSLTQVKIENDQFHFWLELPLALGTVGGLTRLHPIVKIALELLQHPTAKQLMQIAAVVGLAQNFAAIGSLITTGIQEGHMKMHLKNILNQIQATPQERQAIKTYFKDNTVSYRAVLNQLEKIRK